MTTGNISQIIRGVALSAFLIAPAFGAKPDRNSNPDPTPSPASDLECTGCVCTTDIENGAVTLDKLAPDVTDAFTPSGVAKIAGIANVALSGGDYSSPLDAMIGLDNWCGIPSSINQRLMKIAPGIYDLGTGTLSMSEWVSIQGSGVETTKLTSTGRFAISSAENVALTDLTVEITGGTDATAIFNQYSSPRIERVNAIASGANGSVGVYNQDSSAIMMNVTC